ncbi:MAG: ATP-dependent helicase UvrD/PcrA [Phycisphaerales bacterium]|nr:ATP-dependent helicase UvrD/PcrA [Phycisphaerales bacterium]
MRVFFFFTLSPCLLVTLTYDSVVIDTEQLLTDLTEPQKEAATHVDGPLLIIAGAGSGKTRVLTRRVAYLASLGIPASSILAITFTNKAAGEMKQRVSNVLDRPIRDFGKLDQRWPTICTFHSLCLRVLRHYAPLVGLPANFTIYDSADQTKVIKDALKQLDVSSTNFSPSTVHGSISNAKNQLLSPADFSRSAGDFYQRQVARIYTKYQEILKQNNALDFDDLLLRTAHAFRDHQEMLKELQERFQYILIDEYQDTNHAQYVIAHALAQRHRNICVVGDPDQSIYAWRGADIQNILDFEKDYPDAKVVKLEQNYRSTKTVLAIASKIIANNTQRKDKGLWTENEQGERAKLFLCQDEHDEARVVMEELKRLSEEKQIPWNRMAIFYRMNALSRVMEDALRRANIPYQIARGVEFYNRKEIKDVLAYLRVVANPMDEVSLTRIVNVPPRGIGDTTVKQMQAYAIANGMSLWDAMERVGQITGISTRALNATKQFTEQVRQWRSLAMGGTGDDLLAEQKGLVQRVMEDVVRRSGLEALLRKDKEADELGEGPVQNVNELISSAAEFDRDNAEGTLDEYLANVSLVSDADHMKGAGGAVTLMTLHAAKGLEFPVVAMIGLEEGILPHARARGNINELEEERRLAFVGITRAQDHLILSKAQYRTIRGLRERTVTSPFLGEMPQEMLDVVDRTGLPGTNERDELRESFLDEADRLTQQFRRGTMVRHPQFGVGRIEDVSGSGQHTRAVVDFTSKGRKTLILQFARLEVVS